MQIDGFCRRTMLRRGAPLTPHLTPHLTMTLGALAVAGMSNFGLRLFHDQDASVMVPVWQVGAALLLTGLAGWGGRFLLNWNELTRHTRHQIARR